MERIILFDGVCNYCNAMVNFVIRNDAEKKLKFTPLQSDVGIELRKKYGIGDNVDSVVFVENGNAYLHSTAALRIAKAMGGIWSISYAFIIVPSFIRDWAYRTFAKYRYRLFGRTDACMLPTPDVRERFL